MKNKTFIQKKLKKGDKRIIDIDKLLFSISLGLILSSLFFLAIYLNTKLNDTIYYNVLYPSYLSTQEACNPKKQPIEEPKTNFITAGVFTQKFKEDGKVERKIEIYRDYQDKRVLKHENCHLQQSLQNRLHSCQKEEIKFHYLNEVECYIAQKLPNIIYEKFYGEITD